MDVATTFEEVKRRLENKELEDYSKQDVFERYIVYGSEKELNNPIIQRLLIKHRYTKELIKMATNISNNIIDEIQSSINRTRLTPYNVIQI